MQILTRELVSLANGELDEFKLFPLPNSNSSYNVSNTEFLQSEILAQADEFRKLILEVDDPQLKKSFDGERLNREFK